MPTGINIMFVIKTRDFQLRRKSDKLQPYVTLLHLLLIIPMFYINNFATHTLHMHADAACADPGRFVRGGFNFYNMFLSDERGGGEMTKIPL